MDFSIHTFEITYFCGYKDYYSLLKAVQAAKSSKGSWNEIYNHRKNGIEFTSQYTNYTLLNKRGINRIRFYTLYAKNHNDTITHRIKFIINPRILLHYKNNPYTKIVDPKDLPLIPDALNSLLQELVPGYPDITEYGKLTRIDYCTNLWFHTQKEADEYFNLLKRYYTPAKLHTDVYSNKEHHRKEPRDGEISLSCKSYTLSIYEKQKQLIGSDCCYPPEEIENADGQLRIELRLKRKKLYSIKETLSLESERALLLRIPYSVLSTLLKKLSVMYGTGDFFSLSVAKARIISSGFKAKTISAMIEILENTSEKRTLDCYNTTFNDNTLKKHLKKFNILGVSPITIPFRYSHDIYPNLLRYITGESFDYLKINALSDISLLQKK